MKKINEKILFVILLLVYIVIFFMLLILLIILIKNYENTLSNFILTAIIGMFTLGMIGCIYLWIKENYYYCPKCKKMRWVQLNGHIIFCEKCGTYIGETEKPSKYTYDEDAMP